MIIIYIIGLVIYVYLPLPGQIVFLLLNIIIPDPIPYVDEIIMYGSVIRKIRSGGKVVVFLDEHPALAKGIAIFVVGIGIIWLCIFIWTGITTFF